MKVKKLAKKIAKDKKAPEHFIKKQLVLGKKVEKEHGGSQQKALKVAKDHLEERPDYYRMLKKAEKTPVKISGKEDWNKYEPKKLRSKR